MPERTVAFLGTGLMGAPMAANLLKSGFAVRAWNRSRDKAEPLAALGATVCDEPDGATAGAGFVVSMLADTHATDKVLLDSGLIGKLAQGTIVIVMSSLSPEDSRRHAKRCKEAGVAHIDAPVSGGPSGARDGTLAIMAGGEQGGVRPLRARIRRDGPARPWSAARLRPARQARQPDHRRLHHRRGERSPAARRARRRQSRRGARGPRAASPTEGAADPRPAHDRAQVQPGAAVTTQLKDMDNILREAKARHLKLPSSELTRGLYAALVDRGLSDIDHSGAYLEIERLNGIGKAFSDSESPA